MIPHNEQKHNTNQTPLQHIGNLASHKGKSATNYDSVNSLTTHNNQYTLLYPDLVQELFNFTLHNSNIEKNNLHFLRDISVNNAKSSSLDSSLPASLHSSFSPRDILFFLQIVSLYQLELSKGNSSITYPSLKLAKLLGADASCDSTDFGSDYSASSASNIRATILKMTSKLESLGLLKVFRRKRSNGMDMANKLIPVLPDRLYSVIKDSPSNLKVSNSSKLEHESNLEHILRTKLFVPIELEFMKSLFKNHLPSKYKLFFLNCIMSAYRNFRQNSSSITEGDAIDLSNKLSFSSTSHELMKKNNISRSTLDRIFRYVKQQGDSFFLKVEHKYTKSDDIDCNRYDKSIFVISINPLVFPISQKWQSQTEEISNFDCDELQDNDLPIFLDTYEEFKTAWSKKQPSIIKKTALNNKDIIIKISNKDIDENLDKKNEELAENNQIKPQTFLKTSNSQHLESELCSLSSKSLKNSIKAFIDALPSPSNATCTNASKAIKENLSEVNKTNIPNNFNVDILKKTTSQSQAINDRKNKDLRYFYPLSEKEAKALNFKANREFSTHFTNQLLLKLYIKDPEKRFKNKFTFSSYMIKALKNEHHQGPRVNNPSFRFSCNIDEQEKRVLECEQYLSKVESSSDTCKISQVKKKIAGRFSSEISHFILTTAQFIESSSRELLTILLPENIALSDMQREILTSEVCSVYGNNNCYFDSVKTGLKISNATGNKEEIQSVSTSEPSCSNPRSTPLSSLKQDSVWHQVRQALVLQYGNDIDAAWFSKAVAKECHDTSLLTITMPTRFMADWLKNHYGYAISRISGTFSFKYIEYNY